MKLFLYILLGSLLMQLGCESYRQDGFEQQQENLPEEPLRQMTFPERGADSANK